LDAPVDFLGVLRASNDPEQGEEEWAVKVCAYLCVLARRPCGGLVADQRVALLPL
jgi:hypothetical protein